uniref:Mitochondrial proton/calcium exchanger protein n=1 Tax=Ditylenchus dipsaci TaxID=166011 RepID=A0A915CZE6_9BILA
MKLFEDELTLDNLSMSQLRALCRILSIQPLGTPEILRFQLTLKLRDLKADDKLIAAEGGSQRHASSGVSEERLRNQLKQWLELSLNDKVPPSLLLLSRALFLPEEINFVDRLKTILSVLPEELGEQTRQKITEMEGGKIDPKARLELLKSIEEGLTKEQQHPADEAILTAQEQVDKLHQTVTELTALGMKDAAAVEQAMVPSTPTATKETKKKLPKSPIQEARYDITELKEKVIEHSEDLIEVGALADDYAESKIAKRLRGRVNSMISGMDALVANLEKEKKNLKEEIADPSVPEAVVNKEERLVKIKDLLTSLQKLQKVTDIAKSKRIEEILHAMDVDKDGSVDANLVLEVIELLGKHKDVALNAKEMSNIIEMLKKEDVIEALDRDREEKSQLESVMPKIPAEDVEFPVRSMSSVPLPPPPSTNSSTKSSVNGPPPS